MRRTALKVVAAAAALMFARPAAADTVCDWWEFATRLGSPMTQSGGPRTADQDRSVTRVSLAMFEALNAIDRRYESYLNFPEGDRNASQDAAAATAAYQVLLHAFPGQKTMLDENYAAAMAAIKDERAREAGKQIGEQAAAAAIAAGGIDPAIAQAPYRPRTAPGEWTATALPTFEAYSTAFRPWAIGSADALRPPPPPALNSEQWARDYEEVRRLGGRTSADRTPQQTLMARHRLLPDVTPSMRLIADAPGRTPVQNARMFAVYQMAYDDAVLAMVAAKLHYNYWRPITAIRNGDGDGNDATALDAGWVPLLGTPNFPEYPCGHCTFAAAIAEIMEAEVGERPATGVRVTSLAGGNPVVQVLTSWDEWTQQVSDSRIYAGAHFRFSNDAGEEMGRRAARMVLERVMRPLPGHNANR